jgi:hypothetical protein
VRLVTWNCCSGPLDRKLSDLATLAADIAVVPECPRPRKRRGGRLPVLRREDRDPPGSTALVPVPSLQAWPEARIGVSRTVTRESGTCEALFIAGRITGIRAVD